MPKIGFNRTFLVLKDNTLNACKTNWSGFNRTF